jgi:cell surface protein SprA
LLDPYVGNGKIPQSNTGKIYFNLGEISEDVLKDGRKQYENGLGPDQILVNHNLCGVMFRLLSR